MLLISILGSFSGLVSVSSSVLEWCSATCSNTNLRQVAGLEEVVYRISSALIFNSALQVCFTDCSLHHWWVPLPAPCSGSKGHGAVSPLCLLARSGQFSGGE